METLKITGRNFNEIVDSGESVLIDFWAPWCGPCRAAAPIVDEVAEEIAPDVRVGKVDVDSEPELADRFEILSVPTLVLLKKGKVAARTVGLRSKDDILEMVRK